MLIATLLGIPLWALIVALVIAVVCAIKGRLSTALLIGLGVLIVMLAPGCRGVRINPEPLKAEAK